MLIHGMDNLASIVDLYSEFTVAEIHHMMQIDGYVLLCTYVQNQVGTIVATAAGVKDFIRQKVHEQQGLGTCRDILGQ